MIYSFVYNSAQAIPLVTFFNSIVKYNHLLWRSRRKCAATKMVSALSFLLGLGVLCMSCLYFVFVKFHIFCRLQGYQLFKYVNFLKTISMTSLMGKTIPKRCLNVKR